MFKKKKKILTQTITIFFWKSVFDVTKTSQSVQESETEPRISELYFSQLGTSELYNGQMRSARNLVISPISVNRKQKEMCSIDSPRLDLSFP